MAKSSSTQKGSTFVMWLIGIAALTYNFEVIVSEIKIWGFLATTFFWSVFCIRES